MTECILEDEELGRLLVRVNIRARRLTFRTREDAVYVTVPPGTTVAEVKNAVEQLRPRLRVAQQKQSRPLIDLNYKIDADWENLINKYLKCRKLNKELADAFVDKVQVFEDGRISVNLVYDDCLEELLQVKNKREGDLYE